MSDGFEKIVEALAVYDLSRDSRDRPPNQQEQWAFHSMQAVLWRLAGTFEPSLLWYNFTTETYRLRKTCYH